MGKNNRSHRQQKQRKKQQKQKQKTSPSKHISSYSLDDVEALCNIASTSLKFGELPPPDVMKDFHGWREDPQVGKLQQLLAGLLDYLFLHEPPIGTTEALSTYQASIKKAGFTDLYSLLELYCLLTHPALEQNDVTPLIDYTVKQPHSALSSPLHIALFVLGVKNSDRTLSGLLEDCLGNSEARELIKPLSKFLQLKRPLPKQKTVIKLEQTLARIKWQQHSSWPDAIKHIIQLFIQDKPGLQLDPEQWAQLPALGALLGFIDNSKTKTASIALKDAGTELLQRIDKHTEKATLNYQARLQYELIKCRIYSNYITADPAQATALGRQLEPLFTLCCTGVPTKELAAAKDCLDNLVQWLCRGIQMHSLPLVSAQTLRIPCKQNPQDYRLALLNFLAPKGRVSGVKNEPAQSFHHVDTGLFFYALNNITNVEKLLAQFYWPLTGENKKMLASYVCRELLLSNDETNAQQVWRKLQNRLFDTTREPLANVINGEHCETEWLFFTALMTLSRKQVDSTWIKIEHIDVLLRFSGQWLKQSDSELLIDLVCKLFNQLCLTHKAKTLLAAMESLCTLIEEIDFDESIEESLFFLLRHLSARSDKLDPKYQTFYQLCRPYPKLHPLIPKPDKKTKKAAKSPNLNLFGYE